MNNRVKWIALIFLMVTFAFSLKANNPFEITIDNAGHVLKAPEGENFQWFYNEKQIEGANAKKLVPQKSGTYSVTYRDEYNNLEKQSIVVCVNEDSITRIFIIGDSTVQNYGSSSYPQAGWGQVLHHFFEDTLIAVSNRAIGGRSSRSFWEEGRWDGENGVVHELDSCSYLFIQFGHNDRDYSNPDRYTSPDSMKHFLRIYVNESREQGATPVLVSPMNMNNGPTNVFTQPGSDYRGAMLDVSEELDVPFIDLNTKSFDYYQEIGVTYAKYFIHMGLEPDEYPNYPNGYSDFWTHYQEMGALVMARFISEEIEDQQTIPDLVLLADALKPLHDVSIELNVPDAGMVTLSGKYPEGANVTLKAKLEGGDQLHHWIDSIGNDTLPGNLVTFTMEPRDYAFTGLVTDCYGIVDGTATIDECGVCTGGETGIDPCSEKISFLEFCETNMNIQIVLDEEEQYKLFMNPDTIDNAYIRQEVEVINPDNFLFAISYSDSTANDALNIYVDDSLHIEALPLESGSEFRIAEFSLNLEEGIHMIEIKPTSPTEGLLLDYLALYSQDVTKGACTSEPELPLGSFIQQDNLIVIETENFNDRIAGGNGDQWIKGLFGDASQGRVTMAPDGTSYGSASDAESDAPVLRYNVDFPSAGDYAVWARVYAFGSGEDSYHLGLDGEVLIEKIDLYFGSNVYEEFTWLNVADQKLEVDNTGIQSLDVFCREPNLIIDKIILTLNTNYTPEGYGPDQTYTTVTDIDDLSVDDQETQMIVYPNPSQEQIKIAYNLTESIQVKINVLNINGQIVTNLVDDYQGIGKHEAIWNLNNSNSGLVTDGIYLIVLQTGDSQSVSKVLIQR